MSDNAFSKLIADIQTALNDPYKAPELRQRVEAAERRIRYVWDALMGSELPGTGTEPGAAWHVECFLQASKRDRVRARHAEQQLRSALDQANRVETECMVVHGTLADVCDILFEDDERAEMHAYDGVRERARELVGVKEASEMVDHHRPLLTDPAPEMRAELTGTPLKEWTDTLPHPDDCACGICWFIT